MRQRGVFKEITNEDLSKIKEIILDLDDAEVLDDFKAGLFINKAIIFSDIDELLNQIRITVLKDFKETYFEASSNNWEFCYFLTNSAQIYKNVIFVSNKLSRSSKSGDFAG